MQDTGERAARNQSRLRELNEAAESWNAAHVWSNPALPDWRCECADTDCEELVRMSLAEYETVRSEPTHFLVFPGPEHVVSEVERVVQRTDRYWVVEKVGEAGQLSEVLDPRAD